MAFSKLIVKVTTSSCLIFSLSAQRLELRQSLEQALANQSSEVAGPETLTAQFDFLQASAPPSEAAAVLPLARSCVGSKNPTVRRLGLGTFLCVAMRRGDGAALLADYVDFLGKLLGDPDAGVRGPVAATLYAMQPAPPPAVALYALSHLDDKGNSAHDVLGLAQIMLRAAPHDDSVHREILSRVKASPSAEPALWSGLLVHFGVALGNSPSADEQVLQFIGRGLTSGVLEVQRAAVGAIRGRRELAARFTSTLVQLVADKATDAQVREDAEQALAGR